MRLQFPWERDRLAKWDIVGMNHYYVQGKRHLFVAMVRDGCCIKAEGSDEGEVWRVLEWRAIQHVNLCRGHDAARPGGQEGGDSP